MSSKRISRALLVALLASACAGWQRLDDATPQTLPRRQQAQVWSGSDVRVLHAVRIDRDSISGVPFHQPPTCVPCRVVVPRVSVDSLRLGDQESPAVVLISAGIIAFFAIVAALAGLGEGT